MDVSTGELVKKIKRRLPAYAGVMATPDLVWVGEMDGTFSAFDAKTLEEKWSFNVGSSIKAPAMSYSVDGKQYIAILGGSQGLFNFGHADVASIPSNNTLYVFSM